MPIYWKEKMRCRKCEGKLHVLRSCRKVRLRCSDCGREYRIHEIASDLDEETEAALSVYTSIIYD